MRGGRQEESSSEVTLVFVLLRALRALRGETGLCLLRVQCDSLRVVRARHPLGVPEGAEDVQHLAPGRVAAAVPPLVGVHGPDELEHVAEGVHRFAERELVPLLAGCRDWGGVAVSVETIRFGVQRAEVELAAPSLGRDAFVLALENVGGQIEASIVRIGWADKLTDAQRVAAGAGPDVVRVSIGLEDITDIVADLDQALAA